MIPVVSWITGRTDFRGFKVIISLFIFLLPFLAHFFPKVHYKCLIFHPLINLDEGWGLRWIKASEQR